MTEQPPITGSILGKTIDDITGTTWLLGHDLKSPIAIIITTLEMLISLYEGDENMGRMVHLLRGSLVAANREYNMVCDMLDLARFEMKQYVLEKHLIDIGALLSDCVEHERYALDTKKLNVQINIPADQPLWVEIEEELFRRVFSALVDNAIKFTVKEDRFLVSACRVEDRIEITFSDTGRLIFPDFETDIIERAPQWEKRQAGSRTSVGMGLPYVAAVLKAHNGTFSAKSDSSAKITTFKLILPAFQAK